jgi:mono/diheme cytochrome c family protein
MFKRVVNVVEVLVLVTAALFVLFLFTGWPGTDNGGGGESAGGTIFASNCARCHGAEGSGGIGPQLSDGAVVDRFPDVADEITFVTEGQDGMPSFGGTLSAQEIQRVVEYTRTL